MRDIFIILGIALAALGVGAWVFFYGPQQFERLSPPSQEAVLPAEPLPTKPDSPHAEPVSFTVLETGVHASQVSERKNYAVYDADEFKKLWAMAHGSDGKALPKIDFTKSYVIGVFMGQQSTGGYGITVTDITDTLTTRTVFISLSKPDKGCLTTQSVTRPYQIISVPLNENALAHKDTTEVNMCVKN